MSSYRILSGEQRYEQAMAKVRVLARRELRQFLADQIDILPAHRNREFLIAELDRAYQAGLAHGAETLGQEQEQ